jgi:hypothetical protein
MPTKDEIKNFSILVEKLAVEKKLGLMDAICHHCKESGLEIEVAATLISSALKAKLKEEAQGLNLIKKSSKLPI